MQAWVCTVGCRRRGCLRRVPCSLRVALVSGRCAWGLPSPRRARRGGGRVRALRRGRRTPHERRQGGLSDVF